MALVNVRLDEEDARRAKALKRAGVPLSDLVRAAIRAEYERRCAPDGRRKRSVVVADILAALPDPADLPPPIDAGDRRAVQRHVTSKLGRRR